MRLQKILFSVLFALTALVSSAQWTPTNTKLRVIGTGFQCKDTADFVAVGDTGLLIRQCKDSALYFRSAPGTAWKRISSAGGNDFIRNQTGSNLSAQTAKALLSDSLGTLGVLYGERLFTTTASINPAINGQNTSTGRAGSFTAATGVGAYVTNRSATNPALYVLQDSTSSIARFVNNFDLGVMIDTSADITISNLRSDGAFTGKIQLPTISDNRTYALPNASGTIALTSNVTDSAAALRESINTKLNISDTASMLAPFVQYSDTSFILSQVVRTYGAESIGGVKTFTNATNFNGQISGQALITTTGNITSTSGGSITSGVTNTQLYTTNGNKSVQIDSAGVSFIPAASFSGKIIPANSYSANRTYRLPDSSGTFALTTNLGAYLPLTGGTLTGALNGTTANFTTSGAGDAYTQQENTSSSAAASASFYAKNNSTGILRMTKYSTAFPYSFHEGANRGALINSGGSLNVVNQTDSSINFWINNTKVVEFNRTGGATLTGALSGTSATFSAGVNMATSSGNVGIGTTSPVAPGSGFTTLDIRGAGGGAVTLGSTSTIYGYLYGSASGMYVQGVNNADIVFEVTGGEAGRVKNNKRWLFGTTTDDGSSIIQANGAGLFTVSSGNNLVLSKPSGAALLFKKTVATAQDWAIIPDDDFKVFDVTAGTVPFTMAKSTGAATFSSSVSNNYILSALNTNTTAGTSFGLFVRGGTNASDFALNVNNAANTVTLFQVKGDGAATFSSSVTANSLIKSGGSSSQFLMADGSVTTLAGGVASGTYTPTTSGLNNISTATANQFTYSRVGNIVTVSGTVDVDITAASTLTNVKLSLPIASNLITNDLSGSGGCTSGSSSLPTAIVFEDPTNDIATVQLISNVNGSQRVYVTFQYIIK